jgi:hypothetical protein
LKGIIISGIEGGINAAVGISAGADGFMNSVSEKTELFIRQLVKNRFLAEIGAVFKAAFLYATIGAG